MLWQAPALGFGWGLFYSRAQNPVKAMPRESHNCHSPGNFVLFLFP
jgi:hypothetical protein